MHSAEVAETNTQGSLAAGHRETLFVLPQMAGADAKEAAQALVSGAQAPKQ